MFSYLRIISIPFNYQNVKLSNVNQNLHSLPLPPYHALDDGWWGGGGELKHFSEGLYRRNLDQIGILGGNCH